MPQYQLSLRVDTAVWGGGWSNLYGTRRWPPFFFFDHCLHRFTRELKCFQTIHPPHRGRACFLTRKSCRTFTGEALQMEVLVLHPQHLPLAWLPTLVALDERFLFGVMVCVLRMSHCNTQSTSLTAEPLFISTHPFVRWGSAEDERTSLSGEERAASGSRLDEKPAP